MDSATAHPAVIVKDLVTRFTSESIHEHLDLTVARGEVLGIVGGSGSGKTVLLNCLIGLLQPESGSVEVLGVDVLQANRDQRREVQAAWGVLFQQGALFSALSVRENVEAPLREYTKLPLAMIQQLAMMRLHQAGLDPEAVAEKAPYELSGGMRKRVALARALALEPELLFLDEPTAGLDPEGASAFDQMILTLKKTLDLTVVMITHDLDSLYTICDRVAVLADKHIAEIGTVEQLEASTHPWIHSYFHGARSRLADEHV